MVLSNMLFDVSSFQLCNHDDAHIILHLHVTHSSSQYHDKGGAGVNHVKRDWLEIFNVNCDLYIFFCVKRDWGYLRET